MKKFVTHTILFIIVFLTISLIIDIVLTNRIKRTHERPWSHLLSGKMNNDIIILGSSRAWVQYSPRIIDSILHSNCYNLGCDGKKLDISILCYNLYKKYNNKPKLVLCDIYYMSMYNSDPLDREQFYPFLLNKDIWDCVKNTHHFNLFDRYLPLAKYYRHFKGYLFKPETIVLYKGYYSKVEDWDGTELRKIKNIPYEHDSTIFDMTEQWLKECQEDNVKVIFVHSPMYIEATNKIVDTAAMWTMYRNLANKYDIPILDYSHDSICYDTTLFYNAQHLNRKGAERFSRILAKDLDLMGVIQ